MSGIYWLASFPKSGNTWTRAFLSYFLKRGEKPVDINDMFSGPIASNREIFDEYSGLESGELRWDEIERLKPDVYRAAILEQNDPFYCKSHDAYTYLPDGVTPIMPADVTLGALCLIRNPLDVCVSFAHHCGHGDYDLSLNQLNDPKACLVPMKGRQFNQLPQRLLGWSGFINSWTDARGFPVKVVRYEDMKQNPLDTFAGMARFLGFDADESEIGKAIDAAKFERLREQELESGFREKMRRTKPFFRKGKVGDWREELSDDQVSRIVEANRETMRVYGYLDERDQLVF